MNERPIEWVRSIPDEPGEGGILRRRTVLPPSPTDHDPFLLWGEDWFEAGAFDWHGHRGFETVTYVVDGTMNYANSAGPGGTLEAGDALWTTAGSGFMHDTQPPPGQVAHGLQLWLNLPAKHKMVEPTEQKFAGTAVPTFGSRAFEGRVFAGQCNGVVGPAHTYAQVTFVALRFAGTSQTLEFPPDQVGTLLVIEGTLVVNGRVVAAGDSARIAAAEGEVVCHASEPGSALLIAGTPLGEPVVMGGPFVMNTEEEIRQAYADMEAGRMGQPRASAPSTPAS